MYLLPDFVEDAREKLNKEWPTPDHRIVAENVCLENPDIRTMDSLIEMVERIIRIPTDKIRTITYAELLGDKC